MSDDSAAEIIAALREQNALLSSVLVDQRAFQSRLMTGYEGAHRRVADLCDTLSNRLEKAEATTARALATTLEAAEHREELLSRKQERDLKAQSEKAKQEIVADLARDVKALGLLFAKVKMGIPLTGDDSHGLTDLLSTLSEEQISEVFEKGELKLTMGQRQSLGAVFQSLAAAQAKKLAASNTESANTNENTEATP